VLPSIHFFPGLGGGGVVLLGAVGLLPRPGPDGLPGLVDGPLGGAGFPVFAMSFLICLLPALSQLFGLRCQF